MEAKKSRNKDDGSHVVDPRFSRLHSDPRFQRIPKGKGKVAIDSRFDRMFTDKSFQVESKVDKRGRRKKGKTENLRRYYDVKDDDVDKQELEDNVRAQGHVWPKLVDRGQKNRSKFLASKAESDAPAEDMGVDGADVVSHASLENNGAKERRRVTPSKPALEGKRATAARASVESVSHKSVETSSSEEQEVAEEEDTSSAVSSSEDSSSEDDSDVEELEVEEEPESIAMTKDATRRLAVVNLDWEHVRAVDILVMLKSFLPKTGSIFHVTVYPSEFGLQRMKEEQERGPTAVFKSKQSAKEEEEEEEEEEEDVSGDDEDDDGTEIDEKKLREYEKSKLRYYFAVVECDTAECGNALYTACDGLEFERSSNILDLRFIPDSMSFDREPRDSAKEVPADYSAPDFTTQVLQHSRVKLTWDDDEPARVAALRRKFDADQQLEMDFKDYLASDSADSEDEDEDEDADEGERGGEGEGLDVAHTARASQVPAQNGGASRRKMSRAEWAEQYRKLLLGGGGGLGEEKMKKNMKKGKTGEVGEEGGGADDEGEEKDEAEEMEITFTTGLTDLSERLEKRMREKELQGKETVWEAYLRKRAENRRESKKKKKMGGGGGERGMEVNEEDDDMYGGGGGEETDPFFATEGDPFDDPFFAGGEEGGEGVEAGGGERRSEEDRRKKERRKEEERAETRKAAEERKREEAQRKAELELLLMDDAGGTGPSVKGFNLKAKKKKDKAKKSGKRRHQEEDGSGEDDDAAGNGAAGPSPGIDFEDKRFAGLFNSHHYAIDPTDPRFRKSGGQLGVLAEKQRRRLQESSQRRPSKDGAPGSNLKTTWDPTVSSTRQLQEKAELNSLVRSLKRKAERVGM